MSVCGIHVHVHVGQMRCHIFYFVNVARLTGWVEFRVETTLQARKTRGMVVSIVKTIVSTCSLERWTLDYLQISWALPIKKWPSLWEFIQFVEHYKLFCGLKIAQLHSFKELYHLNYHGDNGQTNLSSWPSYNLHYCLFGSLQSVWYTHTWYM